MQSPWLGRIGDQKARAVFTRRAPRSHQVTDIGSGYKIMNSEGWLRGIGGCEGINKWISTRRPDTQGTENERFVQVRGGRS